MTEMTTARSASDLYAGHTIRSVFVSGHGPRDGCYHIRMSEYWLGGDKINRLPSKKAGQPQPLENFVSLL